MSLDEIERRLRSRLTDPEKTRPRSKLRPAAVLIPLIRFEREHRLLLTKRSSSLRRQPGDIAFPGGAIDAGDPTALAAALRESEEEVGLKPEDVTVLGRMAERETVTGFHITPLVGAVVGPYPFRTNDEVGELLEVPIAELRRPGVLEVERREYRGRAYDVYHYRYGSHDIWGITGRLVKELLTLLE